MFNIVQKLIDLILSLQEKVLVENKLNVRHKSFSTALGKTVLTNGCTAKFTADADKKKQNLEHNVTNILKKYSNNPKELLNYIEKSGTPVYKRKFANRILQVIRADEGFIPSLGGFKALYLSLAICAKPSFKTKPMFVLRDLELDPYYMIHQFHKWYAQKMNLPGFDAKSQENFNKFLNQSADKELEELDVEDILMLKEAIDRDVEAINFVVNLAKTTEQAKKASAKVVAGGAVV